jgi:tRNA(fMet)-specific endonuclease VapC
MYVLDTNTLIHFFQGKGAVGERLLSVPPSSVGVPSVVVYELETGIAKSAQSTRRRKQFESFLGAVQVLAFGLDEAREAAGIRVVLEAKGKPIGPLDTLIAATALARGAVLVTRNVREFARVPRLEVENWYEPA